MASHADSTQRETELLAREHALKQREASLQAKQAELAKLGEKAPNFPPLRPIVYNPVGDVPPRHKTLARLFFIDWLLLATSLCMNVVFMLIMVLHPKATSDHPGLFSFLFAAIFAGLGIILSWKGWYIGIIKILQNTTKGQWIPFWINYGIHVLFLGYATAGAPSTNGLILMIDLFGSDDLGGMAVWSLVATILWGLALALAVWVGKKAYTIFTNRKADADSEKTKREDDRALAGV